MERRRLINLDFDGVLHSYVSGWQGIDVIPDPPVRTPDGRTSIDWLRELIAHPELRIAILSSRSSYPSGIAAMKAWLLEQGLEPHLFEALEFPSMKGPAFLTVDDRALRFEGRFFTPTEILEFRPWKQQS